MKLKMTTQENSDLGTVEHVIKGQSIWIQLFIIGIFFFCGIKLLISYFSNETLNYSRNYRTTLELPPIFGLIFGSLIIIGALAIVYRAFFASSKLELKICEYGILIMKKQLPFSKIKTVRVQKMPMGQARIVIQDTSDKEIIFQTSKLREENQQAIDEINTFLYKKREEAYKVS